MCSIGEDDFGDDGGLHAMVNDEQSERSKTILGNCSNCGVDGALVQLKFRNPECFNCFLAFARHKFRATLGSSKILPKGAEVLLIFDGTAESIVLLDMMHFAQAQDTFKRLHVGTKVLFIDESSLNSSVDINVVKCFLSQYNFESYIISLTNAKSLCKLEDLDSQSYLKWSENEYADDEFLLKNIKSLTSRQNFVKVWKNKLIGIAANNLQCNFVFLPDISTNLAAELINGIALGRGDSVALDVSLLDDRLQNLKLLRPMRNLNGNEVQLYLEVKNIKALKTDTYGETFGPNASIQNLSKRFIDDLQLNFSSTISTVFRTGDKIAPLFKRMNDEAYERTTCTFCNSFLNSSSSRTLEALEFSRLASAFSGNMDQTMLKELRTKSTSELCHACSNIQKECENLLLR